MDNQISIQDTYTKYDIDQKIGLIQCKTVVKLNIFGEKKCFHGKGISYCIKENIFNEEFGKGLAEIRAKQDVERQIETSLVKYTFNHFVREEIIINQTQITPHEIEDRMEEIINILRRNKNER